MSESLFSVPTLREHRDTLHETHRNIQNYGGREGELFRVAFEALLWLTIEYMIPDYDPQYVVEIRRVSGE